MEQKKKNGLMIGIIYLVIFLIYNLLIFLVFKGLNAVFWVSYVFMLAAYLLHIVCILSIVRNLNVRAVFFGIPLGAFSVYFVAAEFFVSLVFMLFRKQAGVKVAVVIQAVLLGVFIVIALISIMTRDAVQHVDSKIKENVSFIKGINVDVEMLLQRSSDAEIKAALKKLSETIKYSDPMSNSVVAIQEQMIMQYLTELRVKFDAGDMAAVKELCPKLELLFVERNKKLMVSK
ncbi:MAG: hypothetical protein K2L18_00700 [Acetatifactor sp.]|nr:hypothetical protein [Acetatifactor sp.]